MSYLASRNDDGPFESSIAVVEHADVRTGEGNPGVNSSSSSSSGGGSRNRHWLYVNGRHTEFAVSCAGDQNPQVPRVSGFSTDMGRTFNLSSSSTPARDDDCTGCHMALLGGAGADGTQIYMSGPAGPPPEPTLPHDDRTNSGRRNLVVRLSKDGGATFKLVLARPGYAGYGTIYF